MRHIRLVVAAALVVAAIAGCTPEATTLADAPTIGSSPKPSAAPTPTATVNAPATKPALSDLVLGPEGLGPLLMAQAPPVSDPALDILVFDPRHCVGSPNPDPGLWIANYPDSAEGSAPFAASVDGVVRRIDVRDQAIVTAAGIHVASTLDSLLAAYPGGFTATITDGSLSDVYIVGGTTGNMLIEVAKATSTPGYWDAATIDSVVFMRVILPEAAVRPIAGTGNVVAGCYSE